MKNIIILVSIIFSFGLIAQENNKVNISYKVLVNKTEDIENSEKETAGQKQ